MPILDFKIPEQTRIVELLGEQISRRLLSTMGVWQVFKDGFFILNDVSRPANFNANNHRQRVSDNRCDVQVTPNYNPLEPALEGGKGSDAEAHKTTRRWMSGSIGEYPLFNDSRSNTYLFEVNVPTSVELEFKLKVKSIELSDMISTALYTKGLTGESVHNYNDVYFQYGIPDQSVILLHRIFSLQEDLKEHSFGDYLKVGSNDRISMLVHRDLSDREGPRQLIVQKTSVNVLGRIESDGSKPESELINRSMDRLELTFRYVFQFGRPVLIRAEYPIMVNNQLLGSRFTKKPLSMSIGGGPRHLQNKAINQMSFHNNKTSINLKESYPLIQFPDTDDFRPGTKMYKNFNTNYQHLFVGLLSVDVDSDDGSLSLEVNIRDEIFPMLDTRTADEIERVLNIDYKNDQFQQRSDILRRLSIFNIAIFSNENIVDNSQLVIGDDLILKVNAKLNISRRYRVVISQIKNLKILNILYLRHLFTNTEYYGDLLSVHFNYLVENGYLRVVRDELTGSSSLVSGQGNKATLQSPHNTFRLGRFLVVPTF